MSSTTASSSNTSHLKKGIHKGNAVPFVTGLAILNTSLCFARFLIEDEFYLPVKNCMLFSNIIIIILL